MSHWQFTLWRRDRTGESLLEHLHSRGPVVRSVILLFVLPWASVAVIGYVVCVVIFPSAFLKLGLDVAGGQPGIGWYVWAGFVIAFYSLLFAAVVADAVQYLKAKVLPVVNLLHPLLFLLGYTLAAWFIPGLLTG